MPSCFAKARPFGQLCGCSSSGMRLNCKSVGRLLGSHLSLMGMYLLFSFVPQVSLMSCVFFKAHTKPSSVIALELGKKIRELPI